MGEEGGAAGLVGQPAPEEEGGVEPSKLGNAGCVSPGVIAPCPRPRRCVTVVADGGLDEPFAPS